MGTSKAYQAPTTPEWARLKRQVTWLSRDGAVPYATAQGIVADFVRVNEGTRGPSTDGGGRGHAAVLAAAGRLSSFAGVVGARGLDTALAEAGLRSFVGQPVDKVALAIVGHLCETGSLLEEVDLRGAMQDLMEELLEGALSYEEVRAALESRMSIGSIRDLITTLLGHYLYRRFCRVFWERLMTRNGQVRTDEFMLSIREYIQEELRFRLLGKDASAMAWAGQEGRSMEDVVLQATLRVFGG